MRPSIIPKYTEWEPHKEMKEKGAERIFEKIMVQKFLNLIIETTHPRNSINSM